MPSQVCHLHGNTIVGYDTLRNFPFTITHYMQVFDNLKCYLDMYYMNV